LNRNSEHSKIFQVIIEKNKNRKEDEQ
jgi:hypothetical protein